MNKSSNFVNMITAKIITRTRTIDVPCLNDKNHAISKLQDSVSMLTEQDSRCRFVVFDGGHEVYSWYYQPTIRTDVKPAKCMTKKVSKYYLDCVIYILLAGEELSYTNLYHEGEVFNSVKEARSVMKERGYGIADYQIVYEYSVSDAEGTDYGTGLGFTKDEAKARLNSALAYYNRQVMSNGTIKRL